MLRLKSIAALSPPTATAPAPAFRFDQTDKHGIAESMIPSTRWLILRCAIGGFALGLCGCAGPGFVHLNDPARSFQARDVANLLAPRDIPYERIEKDGVEVGYSLTFFEEDGGVYRLTLVFRNTTSGPLTIRPRVALFDATGLRITAEDYRAYQATQSAMAGTQIPAVSTVVVASDQPVSQSGTITNERTGERFNYQGTSGPAQGGGFNGSFADSFQKSYAASAASAASAAAAAPANAAIARQEWGLLGLRWGAAFWLKESYALPPKTSDVGALRFPASSIGALPIKVVLEIDGRSFEFLTAATVPQ